MCYGLGFVSLQPARGPQRGRHFFLIAFATFTRCRNSSLACCCFNGFLRRAPPARARFTLPHIASSLKPCRGCQSAHAPCVLGLAVKCADGADGAGGGFCRAASRPIATGPTRPSPRVPVVEP